MGGSLIESLRFEVNVCFLLQREDALRGKSASGDEARIVR